MFVKLLGEWGNTAPIERLKAEDAASPWAIDTIETVRDVHFSSDPNVRPMRQHSFILMCISREQL